MSNLYEDYGLELEPENAPVSPDSAPQPTPYVPKKSGILGRAVALLLGLTLGVGGVVGGVAGTGYFIATQPIKDTVDTVNTLTGLNIELNKYLSDDYAKNTVLGVVGKLADLAGKFTSGKGCLNDLVAVSPYVNTALDPLLKKVEEFGLNLDKDELMETPIGELPTFFMEEMKEMALADILDTAGIEKTPLLNSICFDEDGEKITIGYIMDKGPESLLHNIPLEALLISEDGVVDPAKDGLIMALAYGNSSRYEIDADSKVAMKQMEYKLIDGVLYDIDNEAVLNAVLGANGIFTVTDEDEIFYVGPTAVTRSVPVSYYAYKDADCTLPLNYEKVMVGDLLGGNASDLLMGFEIGSALGLQIDDPLTETNRLTHALAYGYEGTHFEIEDGNVEWLKDEEGNAYKPRTIKELTEIGGILNDIRLATVLNVDPLAEDKDALTLALAYGYEGTHYEIVDGEIEWLPDENGDPYAPRTVSDMSKMSTIINDIRLETALNVTHESPRLLHVLAYGSEGDGFNYIKNGSGEVTGIEPLKYNTISSISDPDDNIITTLKLKDLLGDEAIEGDLFLSHLGDATLDTLPDVISTLTFKQVYPEQIYVVREVIYKEGATIVLTYDDVNDDYYYVDGEGEHRVSKDDITLEYHFEIEDDEGNVIETGYISMDEMYYEGEYYHRVSDNAELHLELTSQWKYLLVGSDGKTHDYKMTEFANLVTNMTYNMTHATLRDLNDDGIVELSSTTLDTPLVTEIKVTVAGYGVKTLGTIDVSGLGLPANPVLGDLTITQIMSYTSTVLTAINNLSLSLS